MSPEAQRIAITDAVTPIDTGLLHVCHCGDAEKNHTNEHGFVPMLCVTDLPDYLNDLNAMHEAEKVLNPEQASWYVYLLHQPAGLVTGVNATQRHLMCDWYVAHATAAQRAEAFLRTLNLWDNSK